MVLQDSLDPQRRMAAAEAWVLMETTWWRTTTASSPSDFSPSQLALERGGPRQSERCPHSFFCDRRRHVSTCTRRRRKTQGRSETVVGLGARAETGIEPGPLLRREKRNGEQGGWYRGGDESGAQKKLMDVPLLYRNGSSLTGVQRGGWKNLLMRRKTTRQRKWTGVRHLAGRDGVHHVSGRAWRLVNGRNGQKKKKG